LLKLYVHSSTFSSKVMHQGEPTISLTSQPNHARGRTPVLLHKVSQPRQFDSAHRRARTTSNIFCSTLGYSVEWLTSWSGVLGKSLSAPHSHDPLQRSQLQARSEDHPALSLSI